MKKLGHPEASRTTEADRPTLQATVYWPFGASAAHTAMVQSQDVGLDEGREVSRCIGKHIRNNETLIIHTGIILPTDQKPSSIIS